MSDADAAWYCGLRENRADGMSGSVGLAAAQSTFMSFVNKRLCTLLMQGDHLNLVEALLLLLPQARLRAHGFSAALWLTCTHLRTCGLTSSLHAREYRFREPSATRCSRTCELVSRLTRPSLPRLRTRAMSCSVCWLLHRVQSLHNPNGPSLSQLRKASLRRSQTSSPCYPTALTGLTSSRYAWHHHASLVRDITRWRWRVVAGQRLYLRAAA